MYDAKRDEIVVRKVLNKAYTQCASQTNPSKPIPTDTKPIWIEDQIILEAYPKPDAAEQQEVTLTWKMWLDTLRVVRFFMVKYPELFCGWEVIQRPRNIQVGNGVITTFL